MEKFSHKSFNLLIMILILAAWAGLNLWYNWGVLGHDLASGYIAARVLHLGQIGHLYSYDPGSFTDVIDPVWLSLAEETGCKAYLHPFVQIPLWAGLLQPLAVRMDFFAFKQLFYILILLAFAGSFLLAFRLWAPKFLTPLYLLTFLVVISITVPFRYSILLLQTHPILFFFIMLALYLDEKEKSFVAGMVMAFPIAIKLTPVLLVFYWLLFRRFKAIAGLTVGGAILAMTSLALTGWQAHILFLERIKQISSITLTGYSNQSIRGVLMRLLSGPESFQDWSMHPTPPWVSLLSLFIVFALFILFMAVLWRNRAHLTEHKDLIISLFIILLLISPPLSWMHYYFMLFIPLVVLFKHNMAKPGMAGWLVFGCALLLQLAFFVYVPFMGKYSGPVRLVNFELYTSLLLYSYFMFIFWQTGKENPVTKQAAST